MGSLFDQTSAQVAQEAENERASLAHTLELLRENLRPANMVDEVMANAKVSTSDITDKMWQTARANPVPAALIGLGAAMLLGIGKGIKALPLTRPADPLNDQRSRPSGKEVPASARVYKSAGAGKENGTSARFAGGSMPDAMYSQRGRPPAARSKMLPTEKSSNPAAGVTMAQYSSTTRQLSSSFSRLLEDQPLVLAALGIAVGAAVGAAIPTTDVESQWMGDASDSVRQNAATLARDQLAHLKATADQTLDNVKTSIADHGMSKDNLSGLVRDIGSTVKDAAYKAGDHATERLPG